MAIDLVTDSTKCCGCAVCESICPKHAISMSFNSEGFLYPEIDKTKCIDCHLCQKSCPINYCPPVSEEHKDFSQKVYGCVNNNKRVLLASSSGGVFYALAKDVISQGGIVFGASFSENGVVHHIEVEQIEDLPKLCGSKYVQSDTRYIWPSVKKYLFSGRKVLFSGTPCEIGALRSYLKKDYENLLLVEVLCMGTPSPGVWMMWEKELENRYHSKAKFISFRSKKYGAFSNSLFIRFDNGREYWNPMYADPYVKGFYNRLFLRNSCHNCSYKKLHRDSDLTLGDFWGSSNSGIKLPTENGLSIVIVQSPKGEVAFNNLKNSFSIQETDLDTAIKVQPMMTKSCSPDLHREDFFRDYSNNTTKSLARLVNTYLPINSKDKLRARLKKVTPLRRLISIIRK